MCARTLIYTCLPCGLFARPDAAHKITQCVQVLIGMVLLFQFFTRFIPSSENSACSYSASPLNTGRIRTVVLENDRRCQDCFRKWPSLPRLFQKMTVVAKTPPLNREPLGKNRPFRKTSASTIVLVESLTDFCHLWKMAGRSEGQNVKLSRRVG